MIGLKLAALLIVAGPRIEPDCQRFCLGECHYDWSHHRCADTMVEYIGTWDPVPHGYTPAESFEFPANSLDKPQSWGSYDTENTGNGEITGMFKPIVVKTETETKE